GGAAPGGAPLPAAAGRRLRNQSDTAESAACAGSRGAAAAGVGLVGRTGVGPVGIVGVGVGVGVVAGMGAVAPCQPLASWPLAGRPFVSWPPAGRPSGAECAP